MTQQLINMTKDRDLKTKVRLEKEKSKRDKDESLKLKSRDEILETMLNTPPETHEEIKDK